MDPQELIEERQATHGETWILMSRVLDVLLPHVANMISSSPYSWAWMMIMSKLIRALFSPTHLDHWRDIQGYAQLVINNLEANYGTVHKERS